MESKVSQIAEKLLKEGVEQGETEKKKIVDSAREEASSILAAAESKAASIIQESEAKAAELKKNAESEIKLSGEQAVSALKQKITDLVITETVEKSATGSLADPKVMGEYINTALQNWKGEASSVEVLLPEASRASMESALSAAVQNTLFNQVKLTFSKAVKGGFQIAPTGSSYKITMSDEDFSGFFKEYLRPRVRSILFGE